MPATLKDIRSFSHFAEQQLSSADPEPSIDELFDMWRAANPPANELAESVNAVKAAIAEMEAGDNGIPAHEHLARLRSKFRPRILHVRGPGQDLIR